MHQGAGLGNVGRVVNEKSLRKGGLHVPGPDGTREDVGQQLPAGRLQGHLVGRDSGRRRTCQ